MAVYTINFDTMLDELAARLEITRPDQRFTDTMLKRWINLGIIEFAKRTNLCNIVKFLHLSANINRYTMPSDWLRGKSFQVLYLRNGALSGYQYPLKQLDRRGMQSRAASNTTTSFLSAGTYNQYATGYPQAFLLDGNVIEFDRIPTSASAGARRICMKFPGIPDEAVYGPSTVTEIPLEHRMVPLKFAQHWAAVADKDPRAQQFFQEALIECEQARTDAMWADQQTPPSLMPEEYYNSLDWDIV